MVSRARSPPPRVTRTRPGVSRSVVTTRPCTAHLLGRHASLATRPERLLAPPPGWQQRGVVTAPVRRTVWCGAVATECALSAHFGGDNPALHASGRASEGRGVEG